MVWKKKIYGRLWDLIEQHKPVRMVCKKIKNPNFYSEERYTNYMKTNYGVISACLFRKLEIMVLMGIIETFSK